MDSRLLYMYILMILTLSIGFFIGLIFRRNGYRKKYEDKIYELQYLEEERFEALNRVESNFDSLQKTLIDKKNDFRIKSERLDGCIEEDKILKAGINEIRGKNEAWVKNTPIVDDKINEALEHLDKVKRAKTSFLAQIEELNHYDNTNAELDKDIERIELLVSPALERKNKLKTSLEKLTERLEQQESELKDIDIKIIEEKDEYALKKSSVEMELHKSETEEENCRVVLEKIEDKIINGKDLSSSDFKEVFANENNSSGWFTALYGKSKNLFKGEK